MWNVQSDALYFRVDFECVFFFWKIQSLRPSSLFHQTEGRHSLWPSISFVFVVLSLESTTAIVENFRNINDNYRTGSGFMITGLLAMVFSLLYLIVTLNTDLSDYMPKPKAPKEEAKEVPMTYAESMTPIDVSSEAPAVVKVEAV